MKTLFKPLLAALCLLALSTPAMAQNPPPMARSYATEDLRSLSYQDQVRVIGLEYEEQSGGRRIPDDQLRFYLDQVNRSNWRFNDIKRDIAQSLNGGWNGPGPGPGPGPGGTIRCESTDGRNRACPTPWRGPSRLVRQFSKTDCREGSNWSSRQGEVTVWGGCRGEFAQGWGGGQAGTINCESINNRATTCRTPWRGRSEIVRQLSDTRCREGQNWSNANGQITVWSGCRAVFGSARGGWDEGDYGNGGYTVTCASDDGRYTTCHWPPGQGRPRLIQQLSKTACVEGRTWGVVDRNQIWVNGGCRGRFGN